MSVAAFAAAKQAASEWHVRILAGLLIAFYVLLPLDRGFPRISLFDRPLNAAIAATLSVLLILIVQSRGAVLSYLREPYSVIQSMYFCVLIVGAFRAPSPPSALHWTLLYYCTFVLNYVILRHVMRLHGVRWLSIVVVFGLAAAGVGIVQGVLGISLPWYDAWFENYFSRPSPDYALAGTRAAGTMNNPILYGFLMALVVPFALDVKSRSARAVALFTLMFAAGLSGSRTAVVVVTAFGASAIVVYRWRAVRALPSVTLGLVLLAAALTWVTPGERDSRLAFLVDRLSFLVDRSAVAERSKPVLGAEPAAASTAAPAATAEALDPGVRAGTSAALGVSLREEAVRQGVREMTQEWDAFRWVVGRGSFTAAAIGMKIQPWYNTVDNVFLSVLYERGLSGLALFVGAFFSFLVATRRAALITIHWFAPVVLAVAGLSFCWDAYSMFNILAVGSMAIAAWHAERVGERVTGGGVAGGLGSAGPSTTGPSASSVRKE